MKVFHGVLMFGLLLATPSQAQNFARITQVQIPMPSVRVPTLPNQVIGIVQTQTFVSIQAARHAVNVAREQGQRRTAGR